MSRPDLSSKFAGLGGVGVKVWRVESFDLSVVPAGQVGAFFTGERTLGGRARASSAATDG
jgi:hypothetical protein